MLLQLKKGIKKGIIIVALFLFFAMLWVLWEGFLKNVIPNTQTKFKDYNSFYQMVNDGIFPNELPKNASGERYFYFTGNMDEKYALSFMVEEESYEELKQEYILQYERYETKKIPEIREIYVLDKEEPEKLSTEFVQTEKIDYVETVLNNNVEGYMILMYEKIKLQHGFHKNGILFNDETNEIVIFSFEDIVFNEEK